MWMIQSLSTKIIEFIFPKHCFMCKKEGVSLCEPCLLTLTPPLTTPFPWITSLYSFKKNELKRVIHALKYFHRKDLSSPFAKELSKLLTALPPTSLLVPIPMNTLRKLRRGHNHTETLVKDIHTITGIPFSTTLLVRSVAHKQQVKTKNKKERFSNQKGAFYLAQDPKGLTIILIDDVTTTGATLHEARNLLLKHGAEHVLAYTIAH